MSNIKQRAVQACLEYDEAKRRIDDLTSELHNLFTACEQRKREKMEPNKGEDKYEFLQRQDSVEPCLNMGYDGHDWNCEDCKKAYQLIQKRKEARQEFGIAKRKVRAVARAQRKTEANQ